jgi:hypothetical protein
MSEHHCLKCRHCQVDLGYAGYSDVTPGMDSSITCLKRHWELSTSENDVRVELSVKMEQAQKCPDYEEG